MPHYTIHRLLNNDYDALATYYEEAKRLWNEIWENPQSNTVEGLAELLTSRQLRFESRCGGRWVGQEVMVWSGFGMLYDPAPGFEDKEKARRLVEAFNLSHCSGEVISEARSAAKSYYLIN